MGRAGTNPMQWISEVHEPAKITIATIVYIPYLSGYWENSLDVFQICINSILDSVDTTFDLMVFDNGSCAEVQEYLFELNRDGKIQYLILSDDNLGKVGAWNIIFSAAPGEIIVYTDSDVLFSPGWFEHSMKVLEKFPKAGMITAQPARGRPNFIDVNSSTLEESKNDPSIKIREGKLIPANVLEKVRIGLGYSEEHYKKNKVDPHGDIELSRDGETAYISASHFQFLSKKSILEQAIPLKSDKVHGGDAQLDEKINELGYWRLSTKEYLVHHMGNNPPDNQTLPEKRQENLDSPFYSIMRYLLRRTIVKMVIKKINSITFNILSTKR